MKIIEQDIELVENTINDNTFDIWYDKETQIFVAFEMVTNGRTFKYKLKGNPDEIAKQNREEILTYRLGKVTPDDVVTIGDIFMHGKFIERIN